MPLNDLTLDELRKLSDWLTSVSVAGFRLEQDGLAPRFDLTPGMPIRVTLGAVMPPATRPDFGAWLAQQTAQPTESAAEDLPSFLRPQSTEAAPDAPGALAADAPEPVDPPPALGEVAGGEPLSAEPSRSAEVAVSPGAAKAEVQAESGGGHRNGSGAMPPAAPVPGSASALAAQAGQWAGTWTEAEDDVVIATMVAVHVDGTTKADALRHVEKQLGRSYRAVEQRAYRLSSKVKAEIARRAMSQAQTETPELPAAEPRREPKPEGEAAVGRHSPKAVQDCAPSDDVAAAAFARPMQAAPDDLHGKDLELWRYLQAHRPSWPHTAGTDLDLVIGLSRGDKLPMISADLGIDTEKLKERFQTLTRPIQDAKGHITIDGGPRLINLLRRIVKTPAEAAA